MPASQSHIAACANQRQGRSRWSPTNAAPETAARMPNSAAVARRPGNSWPAAGWRVDENPARLRIQTIDALCALLTRQMPMLSRFGSQPDTVEDADLLYLEAARATIGTVANDDAVATDVGHLLAHLDNDVGQANALLAGMLGRRDQWLRQTGSAPTRAELEATLVAERERLIARPRA